MSEKGGQGELGSRLPSAPLTHVRIGKSEKSPSFHFLTCTWVTAIHGVGHTRVLVSRNANLIVLRTGLGTRYHSHCTGVSYFVL